MRREWRQRVGWVLSRRQVVLLPGVFLGRFGRRDFVFWSSGFSVCFVCGFGLPDVVCGAWESCRFFRCLFSERRCFWAVKTYGFCWLRNFSAGGVLRDFEAVVSVSRDAGFEGVQNRYPGACFWSGFSRQGRLRGFRKMDVVRESFSGKAPRVLGGSLFGRLHPTRRSTRPGYTLRPSVGVVGRRLSSLLAVRVNVKYDYKYPRKTLRGLKESFD